MVEERGSGSGGFAGVVAIGAAIVVAIAVACGSNPSGVNECTSLEEARCTKMASCPGGVPGGAQSCIDFYDVQCGRGLATGAVVPTSDQLNACVTDIKASCDVANDPSQSANCAAFLVVVVDAGTDGGEETDGADASDATDAGDAGDATDTGDATTDSGDATDAPDTSDADAAAG